MLKYILYGITGLYCVSIIYHYGFREAKRYSKRIGLEKLKKEYEDFEDYIRSIE